MKNPAYLFAIACFVITMSSCVTKKKYVELEDNRNSLHTENTKLKSELGDATNEIDLLKKEVANLSESKSLLEEEVEALKKQKAELLSESLTEKQKMDAAMKAKLEELEKREMAIKELQKSLEEKDKAMRSLLSNLEKALKQYDSDELTIELRDGKVYVAMADKLLFKSGSARVDTRGKEALSTLAEVVSKHNDLDIIVEGHTDNVPIKTDRFADNWDLSVVRATSVVRILTEDYDLDPKKVTASGKGEYYPKADNESAEGRAKNRRTEIIIAPELEKVFELLNN